jgi:hypothetical protein
MSGDKTQSMQDRIAAMAAKTMDVNQFMVDVLKVAMPVSGTRDQGHVP